MQNVTKLVSTSFNCFNVIDTRSGRVVKRGAKGSVANAFCTYYNEEVERAEKLWATWDNKEIKQ